MGMYDRHKAAIFRMVDRTIGEGRLLAEVEFKGGSRRFVDYEIRGTLLAEHEPAIVSNVIKSLQGRPGANLAAVRLVKLTGTWAEAPQWSFDWHQVVPEAV